MTDLSVDVLAVGMCTWDDTIVVDRLPAWDSKGVADIWVSGNGGVATNVTMTLSALGTHVALVAEVGADEWGDKALERLSRAGVNIDHVAKSRVMTQRVVIMVDRRSGTRMAVASPFTPFTWMHDDIGILMAGARMLYLDGSLPYDTTMALLECAQACHIPAFLNMEFPNATRMHILRSSEYWIIPKDATAQIGDDATYEELLYRLWNASRNRLIGITLGKDGSIFYDGTRHYAIPALQVEAVDTTGAGDAFQGALIHGLLAGWSCNYSLYFAAAAAGLACKGYGANGRCVDLEVIRRETSELCQDRCKPGDAV